MAFFRLAPCLLALVLILPGAARAADAPDPAREATAAMQHRYETLGSFSADFTQKLTNAASGETKVRQGKVWFKRPMLVRWDTLAPEKELLVIGAEDVWNWFPEEHTAYRYTAPQVLDSRTMLRFISGRVRLDEDFWVADMGLTDGLRKLQLVPKNPEPTLVEAEMLVDVGRGVMTSLTVIDFFGNVNEVLLENVELEAWCPDDLFRFTPPEDTDVFDDRGKGPAPAAQPLAQ